MTESSTNLFQASPRYPVQPMGPSIGSPHVVATVLPPSFNFKERGAKEHKSGGRVDMNRECQYVFILSTCEIVTRYRINTSVRIRPGQVEWWSSSSEIPASRNNKNMSASVVPGATWPASAVVAEGVETGSACHTGRVPERGLREGTSPGWERERKPITEPTWSFAA